MSCIVLAWLKIIKNFSLEAAETSSVVVEILKLVLAGDQVHDELSRKCINVNVNVYVIGHSPSGLFRTNANK